MEARSLASLNFLAANPPQYPVNPSEDEQEPLTLYISRVPGTRDVILSPFKPQLKNVTGEDVASSLYYVHLDTTAPRAPEHPVPRHGHAQTRFSNEGSHPGPAIARKPIPGDGVAAHHPQDSALRPPESGSVQGHISARSSMDYQPSPVVDRSPLQTYPSRPLGESEFDLRELPPQLPPYSPMSPIPPIHETPLPPPSIRGGFLPQHPIHEGSLPQHPVHEGSLPPHPIHGGSLPPRPIQEAPTLPPPPPPPPQHTTVPARKPVMGPRIVNPTTTTEVPVDARERGSRPKLREPYTSNERGYGFDYSAQTSQRGTSRGLHLESGEARGEAQPPPQLQPDDSQRMASQVYQTDYSVQAPPSGPSSPNRFNRSPSPTPAPKQKEAFTLSLIRRDPSSGNQWNVGRVSSEQVYDSRGSSAGEEASNMALSSSSHPPIDVRIETSGYAKFRHMPSRRSMDTTGPYARAGVLRETTPPSAEDMWFTRQVQMAYSKSWTSTLKEKWNRLEKTHMVSRQGHSRNHSAVSVASVASNSTIPPGVTASLGLPGPGMKPRGYVFTSPWDGHCDFRTGNAGRSLRCHHVLHDGLSSPYNPLVAEQKQQEAGPAPPGGSSSIVSELRYNLPSSELLGADDTNKRSRGHQRLGSLGKFWKREEDDDDDDEVSPFDLNVGKERAGGGNRGSRAKLGKLIVYKDGLKMLDLIVAANVGVWWGTWERSF